MEPDDYWRRPVGAAPPVAPEPPPQRVTAPPPARPAPARVIPPQLPARAAPPPPVALPAPAPGYVGPPPTIPPSGGWQPLERVEPPPPRALPAQDTMAIEREESQAHAVTMGTGILAGLIMLALLAVLCGRSVLG